MRGDDMARCEKRPGGGMASKAVCKRDRTRLLELSGLSCLFTGLSSLSGGGVSADVLAAGTWHLDSLWLLLGLLSLWLSDGLLAPLRGGGTGAV